MSGQPGYGDIGEPAAGVPPQLGNRAARYWRISRNQEVQSAVVVVISPRHRTIGNCRETRDENLGKANGRVPEQLGYGVRAAICGSRDQEAESPIVIIIRPRHGTKINSRQVPGSEQE